MLPTVSARTAIARQEIIANASGRLTRRDLAGGKKHFELYKNPQPLLCKRVLKAIPALSCKILDWLLSDRLPSKFIPWRAPLAFIGKVSLCR
jgi:hypothetical protein